MRNTRLIIVMLFILITIFTAGAFADDGTLYLPSGLQRIEEEAFYGDTSISKVVLQEGITEIGAQAFANSSLTEITLPSTITYIADNAFNDSQLAKLIANNDTYAYNWAIEHNYISISSNPATDFKYNIADGECTIVEYIGNETTIIIPDTIEECPVTSIASGAFAGIVGWYPSGLNQPDYYREYPNCMNIERIYMPDTIKSIGTNAFAGCVNLTEIIIPSFVTEIQSGTFAGCSNLSSVILPSGLVKIDGSRYSYWGAFCCCTKLERVVIPESVSYIGKGAFWRMGGYPLVKANSTAAENIDSFISPSVDSFAIHVVNEGSEKSLFIDKYVSDECDVVVPSVIDGISVSGLKAYYQGNQEGLFYNNKSIRSVVISEGIQTLPATTFYGCSNLTDIYIPSSITSIGKRAFAGGNKLSNIYINDLNSYLTISYDDDYDYQYTGSSHPTFDRCSVNIYVENKLLQGEIIIPNIITCLPPYIFHGCDNVSKITLPDGITTIGKYAFSWCDGLSEVNIPNSVTKIDVGAFSYCTSLKSIKLPNEITEIGNGAFGNNTLIYAKLDTKSAKALGKASCSFCDPSNTSLQYKYIYDYKQKEITGLSLTDANEDIIEVTIPDIVTSIGEYAFSHCSKLTNITLPDSLTSIGYNAFYYCSKLTNITLPDSLTSIGEYAFEDCSDLTNITLPDSVTSIGRHAFGSCYRLTSVTIPRSVNNLGAYVFDRCFNLNAIYVYHNSYAEQWAKDNGYAYYYIGEETFGDIDDMDYAEYLQWLQAQGEQTGSTVASNDAAVSITLPDAIRMSVGTTQKINTSITGSVLIWIYSSSRESIATVDQKGNVTALALGDTTITLKVSYCPEGSKTIKTIEATCKVFVDTAITADGSNNNSLSNFQLAVGDTRQLQYTVEIRPDTEYGQETWACSDPFVASVDSNGLVTGLSEGTTTISITDSEAGLITSCKVRVVAAPTKLTLPQRLLQLGKGESATLGLTTDAIWRNFELDYDTSMVEATVIGKLLRVTALNTPSVGRKVETTIRVYAGDVYSDLRVIIGEVPTALTMSTAKITVTKGIPVQVSAQIAGLGAAATIHYSSANTDIAIVDSQGTISAISNGTTTITATTYNGLTATCEVTTAECDKYDEFMDAQQLASRFDGVDQKLEYAVHQFYVTANEAAELCSAEQEKAAAEAKLKKAISAAVNSAMDWGLPSEVKEAFIEQMTTSIMTEMTTGDVETKLKNISSGEDLVMWCNSRIQTDARKFKYKASDGTTYTYEGVDIGKVITGVTLSMGFINDSNGKSYAVMLSFTDKAKINAYLDEMWEFAEAKAHEVIKATLEDCLKLSGASQLISELKENLNDAAFNWLIDKFPTLKNVAKPLVKCAEAYNDDFVSMVKTAKSIAKYDWNDVYDNPTSLKKFSDLYKSIIPLEGQLTEVITSTNELIAGLNKGL